MKDILKIFIISMLFSIFYVWVINYEQNTINNKFENDIEKIENKVNLINENVKFNDYRITYETEKVDYLEVPEKPINYWTDDEIKEYRKQFQSKNKNHFHNIDLSFIVAYIKEKEGFHAKAYRDGCLIKAKVCPVSKYRYSIGYGTLAKFKNEKITEKEAEKRLVSHINKTIYPKLKNVNFTSLQQAYASIDFAYNVGHNAFADSIVNKDKEVDCAKMTEYVIFNGKENEGLVKRRFENFIQCVAIDS